MVPRIVAVAGALFFSLLPAQTTTTVASLVKDIQSGPSVYYTPEALAYYAAHNSYIVAGQPLNLEVAARSFQACARIGNLTFAQAHEALPVLVDLFPRAIHVVQIRLASYGGGEGTFEDCVNTYIMNAKNQFLFSSSFIDYNRLSVCENFIDETHETEFIEKHADAQGRVAKAQFNLKIVFTYYAAECALSRITGMSLGHYPAAWHQWWQATNLGESSASAVPSGYAQVPAKAVDPSLQSITTGGSYAVSLSTGNELQGTVVSRTDSSLTLLTAEGKPYFITFSLIKNCRAVDAGKPRPQDTLRSSRNDEIVGWDELKRRAVSSPLLEIKTENGSVMRGRLLSMNNNNLTMDLEGQTSTVARERISRITVLSQLSGSDSR